jgi:hypothetical protein
VNWVGKIPYNQSLQVLNTKASESREHAEQAVNELLSLQKVIQMGPCLTSRATGRRGE